VAGQFIEFTLQDFMHRLFDIQYQTVLFRPLLWISLSNGFSCRFKNGW